MQEQDLNRYEERARIIKAMANASRLCIVDELARGERCVRELTDIVGSDMSTVSKHLAVLKSAGIVRDRKRGTQVYYELRTPCILSFFSCVESVLEDTAREQLELAQGRSEARQRKET